MRSIGDGAHPSFVDDRALRSQDLDWLPGKILHINRDGKGLPSNPFFNGNPDAVRSKVYQYGLRNPFRLELHPQHGLFVNDVGWGGWEEINVGPPGSNFGWPCYEGEFKEPNYADHPATASACQAVYSQANHVLPFLAYPHGKGSAIIGGTFQSGGTYPPGYNGNYFFGDYVFGVIWRLILDEAGRIVAKEDFFDGAIGLVKVFSFNDGNIGWLSAFPDGQILKFTHTTGNRTPVAVASSNKTLGPSPMAVQFYGGDSYDPDGDPITYSRNFGDGQGSTGQNPEHTFALARIHRWTGMDGVRAAEGGEGVTGAMIRGLEFG